MGELKLRFRQVHLDFHTSEAIADVGAAFDAEEFSGKLVADEERSRERALQGIRPSNGARAGG